MKIIEPSIEIYGNPHENQLQHIEKIGKICYKSESSITETSAEKFCETLVKNQHLAMTEHGVFVLEVSEETYNDIMSCDNTYLNSTATIINNTHPRFPDMRFLISGSSRGFTERFLENEYFYNPIISYLRIKFPVLFKTVKDDIVDRYDERKDRMNLSDDSELDVRLLSYSEICDLTPEEKDVHQFTSVKFTVDRGISHELVRHRVASFAQSSTRYCNFSKGKFGSEITVIEPFFFDKSTLKGIANFVTWQKSCLEAERAYMMLIDGGSTAQEARSVLPNSLMTEIVVTMNNKGWKHFFMLRDDTHAHPQMLEVATPLHQMFKELYPENFGVE